MRRSEPVAACRELGVAVIADVACGWCMPHVPVITAFLVSLSAMVCGAGAAPIRNPVAEPFMVSGAVLELRDLSTLTRGEKGWGMIAADEGAVIQLVCFVADGAGMSVSQNITLADPPGLEIDFEASTYMAGWFYVTGSHGAGKKKGTYSDPRARIYRFRLATESPEVERVEMASLAPILAAEPLLSPFHRQPLQQRGVNIEGLASRNAHLYLGLRSPNLDGDAVVLRVNADALVSERKVTGEVLRLPVGRGLGIRAMTTLRDGFLLVLGNAGSEGNERFPLPIDYEEGRPSQLVYWQSESGAIERLGVLPRIENGKEEGVLVLEEFSNGTSELVVVYDSIKGGGFKRFRYQPAP